MYYYNDFSARQVKRKKKILKFEFESAEFWIFLKILQKVHIFLLYLLQLNFKTLSWKFAQKMCRVLLTFLQNHETCRVNLTPTSLLWNYRENSQNFLWIFHADFWTNHLKKMKMLSQVQIISFTSNLVDSASKICFSKRLSHASLSISIYTARLRTAH